MTSSCISKIISERLVEESAKRFLVEFFKNQEKLDLFPSTGEVEVKGRLEVSKSLLKKQVEIVFAKTKASAWMPQLSTWASTKLLIFVDQGRRKRAPCQVVKNEDCTDNKDCF